jgi:predicted kinase
VAHIFFLAGAPAVGKSTAAHTLAARFQKSIHIPVDDLREMVVAGKVLPGNEWGRELVEQLMLAREVTAQMAISYSKAGFTVVIDDFWDPHSQLVEYSRLFQESSIHKILLFPSQQAAEERNLKRSGPGGETVYIADGIRTVYENLRANVTELIQQGWLVTDTTDQSVEATVNHILVQAGQTS